MALLLETTFGDLVLDLDVDGSPALCKNILKLAKARYYTNTLIYNIVPGKYCQLGDPYGDGTGGCSIYGLIDSYQTSLTTKNGANNNRRHPQLPPNVTNSQRRFLQSHGRTLTSDELNQKGLVIAMEMANVPNTIGSQFLLTLSDRNGLNDLLSSVKLDDGTDQQTKIRYLSLGMVAEDPNNILSKLNRAYCDDDGRPYADIRIRRALVIHDPFDDPIGMTDLLRWRGVEMSLGDTEEDANNVQEGYPLAPQSPTYDRPLEERVITRIQADDTTLFATAGWDDDNASNEYEEDEDEAARQVRLELQEKQEEEWRKRQETSKAVMLEMLGDRPSADIQAPENVLFVCKLNPFTNDEDLELIFSRFDSTAKAEIIRDPDTGASLQYAFVEFTSNEACNEAYLKMNNALVDDRRIRVDFSQSVAKVWDRYNRKYRMGDRSAVDRGFVDGGQHNNGRGKGRGMDRRGGSGRGFSLHNSLRDGVGYDRKGQQQYQRPLDQAGNGERVREDSRFDSFGRAIRLGRDAITQENLQSRQCSRSRSQTRIENRKRSSSSSVSSRQKKKHRKNERRHSSQRQRSRSREREKKARRRRHRRDYYSSSDDNDDDERYDKKHRYHKSSRRDRHKHRRCNERSKSR